VIEHVIEAMVDAVLVVDAEGRISHANTAAAQITGYTLEQLRAMPVQRVMNDESSGLRTVVRRRIEDGAVLRREESWLIAHDGRRIPVSVTGSAVLSPSGELEGIVLVARDIREMQKLLADKEAEIKRRRQAEDELRALNATIESQLEQARNSLLAAERRATLGTLLGGVGHELRNIAQIQIAAVDELASALAANEDVTELARALLPDLERVGEHITTHGNRLMHQARPEPDRLEPLDLNAVVRDVILMLRGAAKLGRLDIKLALMPEPLMITSNRVRIEQIIFNLVVNAVDAIGDAPGAITLTTAIAGDRAICTVRDTGSGMSAETLARIFEPLFTTKGDKGTGYGLPVAREIVESFGGHLTVESKLGVGTTFTFDLPR
jgi:PAS domain S-box-containing protein